MISRRSFLIDLGSIVTSSFVVRARTHARIACAPLLLAPTPPNTRTSPPLQLQTGHPLTGAKPNHARGRQ
jgi:hypothetical protein